MDAPKRIVVASDLSETSEAALDYAITLAKALNGKVTLVHTFTIPMYGFPDGMMVAPTDFATRTQMAARESLLAVAASREKSGVDITPIVREGAPWEEVNRVADEVHGDLIVVGTHGRRGVAHAILGSVAEKILRSAKLPVLVVHARAA
jgi:nucleotide-binding universal stress UspA family protein